MKVPNLFLPEKDLENATNILLTQSEKSLKKEGINLDNLVLNMDFGFPEPMRNEELMAGIYSSLDKSEIAKKRLVIYERHMIHILKFNDKEYLSGIIKKLKDIAKAYNSQPSNDLCALVRDEYAVFIYIGTKDEFKTKAIDFYKQRFGFEEVRQ